MSARDRSGFAQPGFGPPRSGRPTPGTGEQDNRLPPAGLRGQALYTTRMQRRVVVAFHHACINALTLQRIDVHADSDSLELSLNVNRGFVLVVLRLVHV